MFFPYKCPFLPPCSPLPTSLRGDASPCMCGPATPPLDVAALTTPLISPLNRSPPKLWLQCRVTWGTSKIRMPGPHPEAGVISPGAVPSSPMILPHRQDGEPPVQDTLLPLSLRLLSLLFALGLLFYFSSCFHLKVTGKRKAFEPSFFFIHSVWPPSRQFFYSRSLKEH